MDTTSPITIENLNLFEKVSNQLYKQLIGDPLFLVLALLVFSAALAVVIQRNLVRAGFTLIACFGALALVYFRLGAQLVAVSQILIYAVGIALIVIFAIMLLSGTRDDAEESSNEAKCRWINKAVAFAFSALTFSLMSYSFIGLSPAWSAAPPFPKPRIEQLLDYVNLVRESLPLGPQMELLGKVLMSEQILAFELVSVLLLIAFISAIVLSRRSS